MGFLSNFWVRQYELPSLEVLIYLLVIDLVFLIIHFTLTYQSVTRISASIDNKPQKTILGRDILNSVYVISVSTFLIIVNNIFTHISGILVRISLLTPPGNQPAYLFVGLTGILSHIGFFGFLYGLFNIIEGVLVHNPIKVRVLEDNFDKIFPIVLFFGITSIIVFFFTEEWRVILYLAEITALFVISTLFLIVAYLLHIQKRSNQIIKLRIFILLMMTITFLIFTVVIVMYIPSIDVSPEQYWTRTSMVEFYFFIANIFASLEMIGLYLFIALPFPIRELFGVGKIEFYSYMDDTLDSENFSQWIHRPHVEPHYEEQRSFQRSDYIVLTGFDPTSTQYHDFCSVLKYYFETDKIFPSLILSEYYFSTWEVKKSDLVIVSNQISDELFPVFDRIQDTYNLTIKFDGETLRIDKFTYLFDDTEFALLISIESFWSQDRKLWVILVPENVLPNIEDLFHNYADYFDHLSDDHDIFAVIKFPVEQNQIMNIPPSNHSLSEPDNSYITFLGVRKT